MYLPHSYEPSVETGVQTSELRNLKPVRIVNRELCLLQCKELLAEDESNVAVGVLGVEGASGRLGCELPSNKHGRRLAPDGKERFDALVCVAFDVCDRVRFDDVDIGCLLYTSPSPRDGLLSRMPSSA